MLNALLTWASAALAVIGVALAIIFYKRQQTDSALADGKAAELHRKLTVAQTDLAKLRQSNERSDRQRARVCVLLEQQSGRLESVNRDESLSEIMGELFVSKRNMVVVYGNFGSGKTWLAQEIGRIAWDAGHVAPFQHGLLSATLGPTPAIEKALREWKEAVTATYVAVTEEGPAQHEGPAAEAARLEIENGSEGKRIAEDIKRQLIERYPLVIIDDAWYYPHVEALLAAVPDRPVLVTTRELKVRNALELGAAKVIDLHGLTPPQVAELLREFVQPALSGEPTPKTAAFIDRLSHLVGEDPDPYTVTQTGAEVRARLEAHGGSWKSISQQRLDELAAEAFSWIDVPGDEDHDGGQVAQMRQIFQVRLEMLQDPLQLAVLRTLSLLRPRPEQFTAAEIAVLCLPRDDAGHGAPATHAPLTGDVKDALDTLEKACYLEASQGAFRHSLHNLSRRVLRQRIGTQVAQDFHRAAVRYWRSWVDPRDPDTHIEGATSYQVAITREGADWLRAARNLIYHLSRLDDLAQARQTFTAIYFELFFWWGFYLRYPVLEEFVHDWQTMRQMHGDEVDEDEVEWFEAIQAFHQNYMPGHLSAFRENDPDWRPSEPDYRGARHDWPAVTNALETILRLTRLDGPSDALTEHDQWHTRALIDNFLADSYRYQKRAGRYVQEIDEYQNEARSLIKRCNDYDVHHGWEPACDWLLSWVDREASDEALRRALEAPDDVTRARELRRAKTEAAAAIHGVLAGQDDTTLTADRDELDYETVALAGLTYGDACLEEADTSGAAQWYAAAVVLTAAWNYRPVTDDYTCTFSGHVSEHVRNALQTLLEQGTANAGRPDGIAGLRTVLSNGYDCDWGSGKLTVAALDPAVLKDPRGFMKQVIGPFPLAGRHDVADFIPAALNQAAERTLAWIWDATRTHSPADDVPGQVALKGVSHSAGQ